MADLEFSDSIDSKESLDDHHTSLAELVFAAEQRPSGEVLVRKVHPRTSSARALAAAAAPYCFLHGVERRRPDGSGRLMAPPKRSFVAAVPHAESEGGRAFVHVLCVPGGDAQRTSWDWACLGVVSARLRPELFEPVVRAGAGGKIAHTLIGNTAESHGVPDPAATHAALCELARRAFG